MEKADLHDSPESPGGVASPAETTPKQAQESVAVVNGRLGSRTGAIIERAVRLEYAYAIVGLILGLFSLVVGMVLCLHGATGSVSWTASFLGLKSSLNDAGPGVAICVVGLFMILVTRPKVKLKDLKG